MRIESHMFRFFTVVLLLAMPGILHATPIPANESIPHVPLDPMMTFGFFIVSILFAFGVYMVQNRKVHKKTGSSQK